MSNPWEIKTVEYDKTNAEGNVEVSGYGQISILLNKYVLKEKGKGLSSNDFTDNDKLKLSSIEVGAEKNKLETLTINGGTKIYPNDEKNINLPIPTKVSQLDNDLGYAKLINMSHDDDFSDSYVGKAKFAFQEEESLAIGKNAIANVRGVAIGADTSINEVYDVNINNELLHNVEENIWEGKITEADKAFKNDNGTNLTELDVVIEDLATEIENRKNADETLQNNINTEIQNRINGDNTLQNDINAEIQNRIETDINLTNSLNDEIQNRISEDDLLEINLNTEIQNRTDADINLSNRITHIEDLLPNQASSSNQLADKSFVNSSIQTNTANFRGNWNTWSDVPSDDVDLYPQDYAGNRIPTVNDYLVVQNASDYPSDTLVGEWRFKYTGVWSTNGKNGWMPEYQVNEEPFTSEQLFAINSGITSDKVSSYDSHVTNKNNPHSVTKSQIGLDSVVNTGDSATPVSGGTTKFTTGGAYTELNKKVDKVDGKGLSSNDFTDTYKTKLDNIDTTVTTNSSNLVTSGAVATAISTEVTNRNTAITNAINNLDVSSVGGDGKYISAISETNGKISATSTTMDTAPTTNSVKAVTSGGIKTAISTAETNAKNLANATGTLPVANGGTGKTTEKDAANAFINSLDIDTSDPQDADYYVSQYAGGGTTNTAYYRRPVSKLWEYIKDKISSVLGLTANQYNGNAKTATNAEQAVSAKNMYQQTFDLSSFDKTKFYPLVCSPNYNFEEVAIFSEGGTSSLEFNQNRIHFDISTTGWADTPFTLNIREYACHDNNEIAIGCIGKGIHYGAWAIWLRGGIHYVCFSRNADLSLKTSDYTFGDEVYTVGTNYYGGANSNVDIVFTPQSTITHGSYSSRPITAPNFIGNLTGNSETATTANKVKNALTINGQSFDGSSKLNISIQGGAYDHIVHDGDSLLEWANCTDGSMKKVLIKSGAYNMTKGVDFSKAGTGYVFAENGAVINSNVPIAFTAPSGKTVVHNLKVVCGPGKDNTCAFSANDVLNLILYDCEAGYATNTITVDRNLFSKCTCYNCHYYFTNSSANSSITIKVFYQCYCYNCICKQTISANSSTGIVFGDNSYFYKECVCVSCDAELTTLRNIKAATAWFTCYYNCWDRCVGCISTINVNSSSLTVNSTLYGFLRCQYMSSCKETHTEDYSNIKGIVQCDFISSTSGINGGLNTHVGNSCSIQ